MAVNPPALVPPAPRRRALLRSAHALLREITNPSAYASLAVQAKYPVGAMLISQTILGFGVAATLSRLLGSHGFGEYAVVITIAGIFHLVAAFPVESGVPKFLAEARQASPSEVRAYYTAGLWLRVAAALLALLLAAASGGWIARAYRVPHLSGAVLIASVSICLFGRLSAYFLACVQGMERPRRWATGNLVGALLVFPLTLLGGLGFARWGHSGLFLLIAAGWLLAAVVAAILARGALGFLWPQPGDGDHLRRLVPFLLPIWIVPLVGLGSRIILQSLLAVKRGPVPVGHLEIAFTLLLHLATVYQACMIVLLPAWARLYVRREAADLLRSLSHARGALIGVATAYGGVLVFGGQWVVPFIFGPDQAGAVLPARVIGLVMPIMISGWVASGTNVVSNRTGNIGKANLVWFSIVMPLGLLLIPPLGALGAALAFLGAYSVFSWFYISRARPFFREVEGWAAEASASRDRAEEVLS